TWVPVRSAVRRAGLAVRIVAAARTFGRGLATLVYPPDLYGWKWNYALSSGFKVPPQSVASLRRDPLVAAVSGVSFGDAQIDGQTVPVILGDAGAAVSAPVVTGHPVESARQIVLGAATLAQLHKQVGDA